MTAWLGRAVAITPPLLAQTYLQLRSCGQRRRECHALWISSLADPHRIARVVHPAHSASMVSVELNDAWLNRFFWELADHGECIRAQVHSHPGSAFHSGTDDRWPTVRAQGFLSLVIPDFATGEPDLKGAFLAEQDEAALGGWREVDMAERILVAGASVPT